MLQTVLNPPSVMELRSEVLTYLRVVATLLDEAGAPLDREQQYRDLAMLVENERHKVESLELRMAIVAPMKAGKSTIVNAILGQGILPARNSAMTSIPSEIVRTDEVVQPQLQIPKGTIERFSHVWSRVHSEVKRRGLAAAKQATQSYPELSSILDEIDALSEFPVAECTVGSDNVQRALGLLNDLCRLAPAILEGINPLGTGSRLEIPRLVAPFLQLRANGQSDGLLVVVDTPGPNEARQHEILQRVVFEELKKTSLVLLVLDYTQLNTEAADRIGREVQQVVEIVGEENLFVLVNKIDDRNEKGMTPEEVRQFVASHLSLKAAASTSRIFEVSAKRAFCAASFLRELECLGDAPEAFEVKKLPSTTELAKQVFGATSWEEELEEADVTKLKKRARKLWDLSGFDSFLSQALAVLMRDVVPRCMSIALKVARSHLVTLRNDSALVRKALVEKTEVLAREVAELDIEIQKLESARQAIEKRLRSKADDLRNEVSELRRRLQQRARVDAADFFKKVGRSKENFWGVWKRLKKGVVNYWRGVVEEDTRVVYFDSKDEANELAQAAVAYVMEIVRPRIESEFARVDRRVSSIGRDIEIDIESRVRPILLKAAERLRRQFDVQLEIPRPVLGNPLAEVAMSESLLRHTYAGEETRVRYERRWYTLWLWRHKVTYTVKVGEQFSVSLDDVAQAVDAHIQKRLDEIATQFHDFLEDDFLSRVEGYFHQLKEYLRHYRESLNKVRIDHQLSLQERDDRKKKLDSIFERGEWSLIKAHSWHKRVAMLDSQIGELAEIGLLASIAPVNVFFSYCHADEEHLGSLEHHLATLRRNGLIQGWSDGDVGAGEETRSVIRKHLEEAQVIVLLLSPDYLGSDYLHETELVRALDRHREGTARVIPVVVRSCDWNNTPIANLEALPPQGQPVASWDRPEDAWLTVSQGIRDAVERVALALSKQ